MIASNKLKLRIFSLASALFLASCGCENGAWPMLSLHDAYQEMNSMSDHPNVSAELSEDGCTVVITSTGQPDHTSIYWEPGHPLHVEPIDEINAAAKAPGFMVEDGAAEVVVTVWANPQIAAESTSPGIGRQGMAVSGGPIFSQYEGFVNGNFIPLEQGVANGFDRDGGHANFGGYHYHLEPTENVVINGDELIGVMNDGFFLYGAIDWETGEAPSDLDESGGHWGRTQHSGRRGEYHYHASEEFLSSGRLFAFPYDFKGELFETPGGGGEPPGGGGGGGEPPGGGGGEPPAQT